MPAGWDDLHLTLRGLEGLELAALLDVVEGIAVLEEAPFTPGRLIPGEGWVEAKERHGSDTRGSWNVFSRAGLGVTK